MGLHTRLGVVSSTGTIRHVVSDFLGSCVAFQSARHFQGLDSGFQGGEDESYNVYSEPWRNTSQSIYRPRKNAEKDVYGGDVDDLLKQKRLVALD